MTIAEIRSHIGGRSQIGSTAFDHIRPVDGKVIGRIVEAGPEGVEAAVELASSAFKANRKTPVHQRVTWLHAAATALSENAEQIATLISEDVGKPIGSSRFEVRRGVEFLQGCATALPQMNGEVLPLDSTATGAGQFGFTLRTPYGITPFNAPVNLLVQKVGPAIAAGNAIIVKPAPAGTRTALRLAELFEEAGWPTGLFTVLTGDRSTANALVTQPFVRAVSFTGGTAGADALARAAGAKQFVAELGSNAANIVLADAAKRIASAAFEASGQQCISAQRVLVQEEILGQFLEYFSAAAKAMKCGRPDDPATDIGPMVSKSAADRVMAMGADAIEHGDTYALPPTQENALVTPCIVCSAPPAARLWKEEVFGPIALIAALHSVDEALRLANDSPFGLQGSVFTRNLASVFRFVDRRRRIMDQRSGPFPARSLPVWRRQAERRRTRRNSLRDRRAVPDQVRRHQTVKAPRPEKH
jgi:acyl-CoA reductase-like NAD-dependent aldehyde dehydrogenase